MFSSKSNEAQNTIETSAKVETKEELERIKREEQRLTKEMEKIAKKLAKLKEKEEKLNAELKDRADKLTKLHVKCSDNPKPEEHEKALYEKLWQKVGFNRKKEEPEPTCESLKHK